ncbi:hypothetical protein MMC26_001526 [Xylographa opegraphella]|nr:hypothetical protein [Xylographa opegraphella]
MSSNTPDIERFMETLGKVSGFQALAAVADLKAASLTACNMSAITKYFSKAGSSRSNCIWDGTDCSQRVQALAAASTAAVIPTIDDHGKKFAALVNQEPAFQVPKSKIQDLITPMYAEHINTQIALDGFSTLRQLYTDTSFATFVKGPFFNPFQDQPDNHCALNVLFTYEYFMLGPDFVMPQDITKTSSYEIVQRWQSKLSVSTMAKDQLIALAQSYGYALSGIFSVTGTADAQLSAYVAGLANGNALFPSAGTELGALDSSISQLIEDGKNQTLFSNDTIEAYNQATSFQLWYQWNTDLSANGSFWQIAVMAAEADGVSDGATSAAFAYTVNMIYGGDLVQWAKNNAGQSFINANAQVNNYVVEQHSIFAGSCFSAGTQIMTDQGSKPIEKLSEGTRLLTHAQPQQYGIVSDENVIHRDPKHLFGFNGEREFFTPGHVFFTTTGLRAIVPEIARVENPWLDVGKLQVGHILLHTSDGKKYQHVQIRSIRGRTSQEKYVYGVHLREGLRSYHANGYLVALNYPEITVSSIAAQLQEIPQAQRLRLLSQSGAVIPYLRRFGGQTVLEAIEREAKSPSPLYGGKVQPISRISIRELIMPYILYSKDSMKCLARVELHSGVLRIDSKLCEQASFDGKRLSWSRRINNATWEHAYCTFTKKGFRAEGRLIRSREKLPTYEEVAANFTRFQMIPGVLAKRTGLGKTHHAVKSGAMKKILQANDDDPNFWSWSMQYDPRSFDGSLDPTTWKPSVPCGSVTMDIIDDVVDYDSLTIGLYDQVSDAMLSNCKKILPNADAQNAMDQMQKLYEHIASSSVDSQIYHTFNVLYAQKILQASDEYTTWLQNNPDYLDQKSQPPTTNLHFTGIGMNPSFVIPILFQSLKLTTAIDGSTVTGIFTEFDIYSSGRNGTAHWVGGNHNMSNEILLSDAQAEATQATRATGHFQLAAHTVPEADIIGRLASARLDDDNDLMTQIVQCEYDQNTVNSNVQTLLKNVMAWHMSDSERGLFLGVAKPTNLPAQFTTDLVGSDTAKWLANTYARAYICQVLAQDDSQIRSQYRFTSKEIKNIRYFWTGQGGECLAKSGIYQSLERNLTRYQIRTNYPPVMTAYNSDGGNGGLTISTKLFNNYTNAYGLGAFGNGPSASATTLLTKLTAIMDALDNAASQKYMRKIWTDDTSSQTITVTDTNSNQLTYIVLARKNWPLWHSPYWGNPNVNSNIVANKLEDLWLQDTLQDIVLKLLSNDPSITSPSLIQMGKEIKAWGEQLKGWDAMSPKDQSLLVISSFGSRIRLMMAGLAITFGWIKSGGSWIIAKGQAMAAAWKNGAERIGDVAEEAMEKDNVDPLPPDLPGMTAILGKSLLFLVGAAALGAQIWLLSDTWADADTLKRGQLILGVIGSFNNMAKLGTDAIETILRRKGGALDPAGQSLCARFDQEYGEFLQNESAVLDVDASGVGSAPENLIPETNLAEELNGDDIKPITSEWQMVEGQASDELEAALEASLNAANKAARITKAFTIVRGVLDVLGYLVAIGMAIFMTWQLVENWSKLSTGDRIFQSIQVALALIEGIGAAIMVGLGATAAIASLAVGLGWLSGRAFAASAVATYFAAASIFASVTIVLAVIGLLVMIALFIWEYTKPPPANPVEQWMQNTGKPWADGSSIQAPDMPTTFSMPTTYTMNQSTVQEVQMSFKNTTGADFCGIVALEVELTSGPNPAALFNDGVAFQTGDSTKTSAGYCRLQSSAGSNSQASLNIVQHFVPSGNTGDTKNDVNQVNFQIEGPIKTDPDTGLEAPDLTVLAGETLTLFVYGTVYTDQLTDKKAPTCYVSQTQVWSLDSQEEDVAIRRN